MLLPESEQRRDERPVLLLSLIHIFPFDAAWVASILCGIPIILEAVIGLVTSFDIKADVLVSLASVSDTQLEVYKRQPVDKAAAIYPRPAEDTAAEDS